MKWGKKKKQKLRGLFQSGREVMGPLYIFASFIIGALELSQRMPMDYR